jgi:hypothetical protein
MHYLMYATISADLAATSGEARQAVWEGLGDDESFCSNDSYLFFNPIGDGFRIGGRWSGKLTELLTGTWPHNGKKKIESMDDLFGYDDDAMLVTPELYDKCLRRFEGEYACTGDPGQDDPTFADLDREEVSEDFIGEKWIVVVDYHC